MPFDRLRETLDTFACTHTAAWLALPIHVIARDLPAVRARKLESLCGGFSAVTLDVLFTRAPRRPELQDRELEDLLLDALDHYLDREHARDDGADDVEEEPPTEEAPLAAWASARGVTARTRDPVKAIGADLEWAARRASVRTVADAVTMAHGEPRVRAAARAYLSACALRVTRERAMSEHRAKLLESPVDAALAVLDERLRAARAAWRAEPREQGRFVSGPATFADDPPRIHYFESDARDRVTLMATVALAGETIDVVPQRGSRAERGAIALAALDAARALLRTPRADGHAALRAWASTPAWARTLSALDEALAAPVVPRPRSFCIKHQKNGIKIWVGDIARTKQGAPTFKQESAYHLAQSRDLVPEDAVVLRAMRSDFYTIAARIDEELASLVGHPRVYWDDVATPIQVERGAVRLRARADAESIVVEVLLAGRALELAQLRAALVEQRCLLHRDGATAVFAPLDPNQRRVIDALTRHGDTFPAIAASEVLPRLERLGAHVEVEIAGELAGRRVEGNDGIVARIDGSRWPLVCVQLRVRPLGFGPYVVPGEGAVTVRGVVDGERVYAERDLARERARSDELLSALGLDGVDTELRELERAMDVLSRLRARDDVTIEWLTGEITRRFVDRESLRVRVTSQRDWFAIGGEVDVDGDEVALATLLAAARTGKRFIEVSPGKLAELTDDLRARLAAVADHAHVARDGSLQIATTAAPAIAELAESPAVVPAFARVLERLRAANESEPVVPAHLATTLRPYQRDGYAWLARLAAWGAGGVLADDMGLGKTLQAIALLSARAHEGPALVIAPTSVTGNWFAELARFGPGLRAIDHREARAAVRKLRAGDVLVASYDLVARDLESFEGVRFATLIVDEAQAVKNASTQRAKAIRELDADVCFALTGTPIENHLGELWSIFSIASPGLLGSWEQFRTRFAQPIEVAGDASARAGLSRLLRPYLLRRTKESVAPELPPLTEVTRVIDLGARERAGYEAMRRAALEQLAGRADEPSSRFAALAALMRLRRLACHPQLVDDKSAAPSSKMEAALEILGEVVEGGHRALVFSQFTDHLALLKKELDARGVRYLYLDGGTRAAERTRLCAAFQKHEAPLFLISLRAGGTGLNLTAADTVVHLDPWWNPAVEDQATDRAHRIGQTRAVTVVRLVARATIEEAVVSLHAEKRALAEGLLEGTDAAGRLSVRELVDLMKTGAEPVSAPARSRNARTAAAPTA